jgi:spastic paraplegia protein 7
MIMHIFITTYIGINPLEGVVMLASTNRVDILDQALLRPGRFDRQILITLPTLPERKAIFEVYLKKILLEKSVDAYSSRLAALTPGHSGKHDNLFYFRS